MTLRLEQLTLAELRDLSRQHSLPDTYHAEQMRHALRTHWRKNHDQIQTPQI